MRKVLSICLAVAAAFSCGAAEYVVTADGKTDAYKLITDAGFFVESTTNYGYNEYLCHADYNHIRQLKDSFLDKYVFAFDIHIDYPDGKGGTILDGNQGEIVDRQRNEIKCMSKVPGTVAFLDQKITYSWKFMIPVGMQTTSEFCHIHQIKGMGSTAAVRHPVITFTCRTKKGKQVLQVINVPYEGSSNVYLAETDLVALEGHWLEATESLQIGQHGQYACTIVDLNTGETVVSVYKTDISIWRDTDDQSCMRGKWGIYRSLGTDLALVPELRNERMLFADFKAEKGVFTAIDVLEVDADTDTAQAYDVFGRPVDENSYKGIIIKGGKRYYQK